MGGPAQFPESPAGRKRPRPDEECPLLEESKSMQHQREQRNIQDTAPVRSRIAGLVMVFGVALLVGGGGADYLQRKNQKSLPVMITPVNEEDNTPAADVGQDHTAGYIDTGQVGHLAAVAQPSVFPQDSDPGLHLDPPNTLKDTSQKRSYPHIVMIMTDDLGYNDVGWADDDLIGVTPTLNRLVNGGVELSQYYTQQLCTPARAALMTGKYPFNTGMQYEVIQPDEPWSLPRDYAVLPEYLHNLGYSSHAVGKWHLGHSAAHMLPQRRGFNSFYGFLTDQEYYYTHYAPDYGTLDFMEGIAGGDGVSCVSDQGGEYGVTLHTDRALSIIEQHSQQDSTEPLFLYLAYQTPHYPLEPDVDVEYLNTSAQHAISNMADHDRKKLAQMVFALDLQVERLVNHLAAVGYLDNTIIIFTSDNGGCPSYGSSNYPYRGAKHHLWEGGSRVRAFLNSPLLPAHKLGTSYSNLFHVTDWLPTILGALNAHTWLPDATDGYTGFDGVNHWDAIMGTDDTVPRTDMVYNLERVQDTSSERAGTYVRGAIRVGGWKLIMNEACQTWSDFQGRYDGEQYTSQCSSTSAVTSCGYSGDAEVGQWLFNLDNDPFETTDLYDAQPDIVKKLMQDMNELLAAGRRSEWQGGNETQALEAWAKQGCISPWL